MKCECWQIEMGILSRGHDFVFGTTACISSLTCHTDIPQDCLVTHLTARVFSDHILVRRDSEVALRTKFLSTRSDQHHAEICVFRGLLILVLCGSDPHGLFSMDGNQKIKM